MKQIQTVTVDTLVVGSGAAGYNAANRILQDGRKSVALLTEGVLCGTSRNTGSDKQTYYKLGLGGDSPDSVRRMAEDLFSYGSVDGDNALCEAALSARSFLHLCELGVPFPVNRYGEYVGYKTDHDPFERATSAGPLTSKFMTEALQREADALGLTVYDGLMAVEILQHENAVCGVLALEKKSGELIAFRSAHVVLATGGPAGIYADSVYPTSQMGSTGLALRAGVPLQNMTEWQYGLASLSPRWNVSGTYMQVLPRFVSLDEDGVEHEFLGDYFADPYKALSNVFLKGYQWPFDSAKVLEGSSVIDLLVYRECVLKHRRVYLDYTKNPFGLEKIDFARLSPEAYHYLNRAEACFGTPIERLHLMNEPAVELYRTKGVDIAKEPLEIALCAQHNNGGIAVDLWWQTSLCGLFAVGECAGTHGISRPGGSALNAGQVGSLRAAQYICADTREVLREDVFASVLLTAAAEHATLCAQLLQNSEPIRSWIEQAQRSMSDHGAAIRAPEQLRTAIELVKRMRNTFSTHVGVDKPSLLYQVYQLRDVLDTQLVTLCAMLDFSVTVKTTRGSALYCDPAGELREGLEEIFRLSANRRGAADKIQEVSLIENEATAFWRDVRPLPTSNEAFETVWRGYRENGNIF
ncbi:MAG: FAD-binding protein [Clostridia bacterium]|nr:FAD-binding protein [Clostridia bacterium]MBQ9798301.1 FAD-binding protein [Clostridia bacterium]